MWINSKTYLVVIELFGIGSFDCLAIGQITQGIEKLSQEELGIDKIFFILLKGTWPKR